MHRSIEIELTLIMLVHASQVDRLARLARQTAEHERIKCTAPPTVLVYKIFAPLLATLE